MSLVAHILVYIPVYARIYQDRNVKPVNTGIYLYIPEYTSISFSARVSGLQMVESEGSNGTLVTSLVVDSYPYHDGNPNFKLGPPSQAHSDGQITDGS